MDEKQTWTQKHPLLIGLGLTILGILLILLRFLGSGDYIQIWPLFLLVPVVPMAWDLIRDPRQYAEHLTTMVMLVFFSVYFLILNYSSWTVVENTWPNFVLAPGLGLLATWGITRQRRQLVSSVFLIGLGLLLYLRILLELAGILVTPLTLLGILLVITGCVFIIIQVRNNKKR